jgi:hypothetical protein
VTTITAIGRVCDRFGFARQGSLVPGRDHPELRWDHWALPPEGYRRSQPARIPVNVAHDRGRRIGHVAALEHDHRSGLWATLALDDCNKNTLLQLSSGTWYLSAETDALPSGAGGYRSDAVLNGLGLVRHPAQTGIDPVVLLAGKLGPYELRSSAWFHLRGPHLERLQRAHDDRRARGDGPIWIIETGVPHAERGSAYEYRRPTGALEYGPRGRVLSVR